MTEQTAPEIHTDPELKQRSIEPKGVLQKNMKMFVFLGACALVVILAAIFSSSRQEGIRYPGGGQKCQRLRSRPLRDNTDNNVADLKSQLEVEKEKEQQAALAQPLRPPAIPR